MPSLQKVIDAIDMIDKQHLDIRTITMGISLLDCASEDVLSINPCNLCYPCLKNYTMQA